MKKYEEQPDFSRYMFILLALNRLARTISMYVVTNVSYMLLDDMIMLSRTFEATTGWSGLNQ